MMPSLHTIIIGLFKNICQEDNLIAYTHDDFYTE